MMTYTHLVDVLAAAVHDSYVRDKVTSGATSVLSRHGTGELLRPYHELGEADREDDRRTVRTVLAGLAQAPIVEVIGLLRDLGGDVVLSHLREAAKVCDPVLVGLVDRCVDAAARGAGEFPDADR